MSGGRSVSVARPAPGYSGKPLWQKLGLKPGQRVWLRNAPAQRDHMVAVPKVVE